MGKNARKEFLANIRGRYRKADRKEKGAILAEFCAVCGYNRKYAIRILNARKMAPARRPGPKPFYGAAVVRYLKALWLATGQMCSRKLAAAIALWLPYYEAEGCGLEADVKAKLLFLSPATIDRLLKSARVRLKQKQIGGVESSLPFPIIAFWSDNGSEFLDHHLWRYFARKEKPPLFARSREYKKNDNAHVEQKNWTHVRQLFGYDRIDKAGHIPAMNEIYKLWGQRQNYFSPAR